MTVFKYVEDKDVFQKFYSKMLARRLVNHQSVSDDAEATMISKLKEACGFEYTSKLQRMFQDVGHTKELNAKFNESGQRLPVDFSIMVLSSNAWPFQAAPAFAIPEELERCHSAFMNFYGTSHSGRKLAWCYQLSKGEMITNYTKSRYTFQVRSSFESQFAD